MYTGPTISFCFCGHTSLQHPQVINATPGGANTTGGTIGITINGIVVNVVVSSGLSGSAFAQAIATAVNNAAGTSFPAGTAAWVTVGGHLIIAVPGSSPLAFSFSMGASTYTLTPASGNTASTCLQCNDAHVLGPENSRVAGMTPQNLSSQP